MNSLWESFKQEAEIFVSGQTLIETFDYSLNISLKYNYLYVETPKVACSSIKTILQKMELGNTDISWKNFEDIHNRDFSPLLKPSQIKPLNQYLEGNKLYKFCFSRNPYTRLLSCYSDKIQTNRPEKRFILQTLGKDPKKLDTYITFYEFVHAINQQKLIEMNPHWRTQYHQTYQENIKYDYIGKIENFTNDIKNILNKIIQFIPQFI